MLVFYFLFVFLVFTRSTIKRGEGVTNEKNVLKDKKKIENRHHVFSFFDMFHAVLVAVLQRIVGRECLTYYYVG